MCAKAIAKPALPPLGAESPYIMISGGRAWLSTLGLAAVMGRPHSSLLAAIQHLDIDPKFRADHFRPARTTEGVRAPGLWISPRGFELLSLTWPDSERTYWRQTLAEAFRAVSNAYVQCRAPLPDEGTTTGDQSRQGWRWITAWIRGFAWGRV
jgi:hypothetical protein